jgi:hypothetical protein
MSLNRKNAAILGLTVLGGLSLSACATEKYVDEQIATVNARISTVEGRVPASPSKLRRKPIPRRRKPCRGANVPTQGVDQLNGRFRRWSNSRPRRGSQTGGNATIRSNA